MKIQFDIKYKPQIQSGEYKVIDPFGHVLTLKDIINDVWYFSLRYPNTDYETERIYDHPENHLFIVTPEEELTDFEDGLRQVCEEAVKEAAVSPYRTSEDFAKRHSAKLLSLAIDARAKEMDEALEKSKLDKDSIPYHLIEFMCNLYTCRNWKEIEETAELYVTRIKAAATKGLPRWKKCEHEMHTLTNLLIRSIDAMWIGAYVKDGQYYIPTNDLILKLPGFKED